MTKQTDLNTCDSPDQIPDVLRNAAELMREQAAELQAAWQDKEASAPWRIIAAELDRAAKRIAERIG